MIEVRQTEVFEKWLSRLKDTRARAKIFARLRNVSLGNFGDVEPVGQGVSELRIHEGKGYRVYFVQKGDVLVILLCGGDKKSQQRDINEAKRLAEQWRD
ncbi:type II toxin-antitoxin system RelE/ParE family toxin [Cohaesibacter haloalkalitolerans]|uniref:type II toxin-antitoxin system RelE/ParE family toxin n=1 Tax=Cohaesibacter haloalkalitolerans TaxID=1162980 RepID=UPI000E647BDA|nr:type II toxin-antitoxin system RelE/ParE family toxin [Cohaesibacter haloalkalitolerans]